MPVQRLNPLMRPRNSWPLTPVDEDETSLQMLEATRDPLFFGGESAVGMTGDTTNMWELIENSV